MSASLISCVVPVYNGERYLGETLDSILDQTYRPIEVIVVDDGSTDGTPGVASAYVERHRELVRYAHQANAGPPAARNHGLEIARGEIITFLDADDLWHAEKLERQAAFLAGSEAVDAAFTHIQNFWIEELKEEAERFRDHRIAQPLPGYVAVTMMAWRRAFEVAGPFDADRKHAETMEWILRAGGHGMKVGMMPDVLTLRRLHPGNRSRVLQAESRDDFLNLLKSDLDRRRGR